MTKKTSHITGYFIVILFLSVNILNVSAQNDTLLNQTDANNLKQGYWEKKYPNGELMYQGYFKDDKPVGEMKRYHENGALQAILNYDEKGECVKARLYYENGHIAAEGMYYLTARDSIWNYYSYYDQTLALKESYMKGRRDGPMLYYYSNGNVSEMLGWKNDIRHGTWLQYFINNTIKLRGTFVNGQLEGDFIVNHEDGTPYVTGSYLNGKRHGLWTFYNEDGTVYMELKYLNGKNMDEDITDEKQKEFFRMIDENMGKFTEPDETNFLMPSGN